MDPGPFHVSVGATDAPDLVESLKFKHVKELLVVRFRVVTVPFCLCGFCYCSVAVVGCYVIVPRVIEEEWRTDS